MVDRAASGLSDFGIQTGNGILFHLGYDKVGILKGDLFLSCSNVRSIEHVEF